MARLILVRHPRTGAPAGLCYGRHEPPRGARSVSAVNTLLAKLDRPSMVITSPSPRCLGPARILARRFARTLSLDPDWRELDFGTWEGRRWSEIDRAESDPWAEDPVRRAPPDGESFDAMLIRVRRAVSRAPDGAVVMTHAGAMRAALIVCEGWSFARAFGAPISYASPIEVDA